MRCFLVFLLFLPVQAFAKKYLTLTTLEVQGSKSEVVTVPTNVEVELLEVMDLSTVKFEYERQKFEMNRSDFFHSVQVTDGPEILAELLDQEYGGFNLQECPLTAQGQLKPGVKWNYASARALVDYCPTVTVPIVKRSWSKPWSESCRPARQDLSQGSRWNSCAPPPACSPSQAIVKNAGAQKRLDAWRLKCAGRNVTIPTDKDPVCTLPLGSPHTLVIHHTEGNMTDGPDAIQRFHLGKGWDDIGYHYILTKTSTGWRAFEGRVDGTEGSHAGSGLNAQSISIAMSGNYLPSANRGKPVDEILPPPQAVLLLKSLVLQIKRQYPTIKSLYGHGEFKRKGMGCDTDCPGPSQQQFVNRMRTSYFPSSKTASPNTGN